MAHKDPKNICQLALPIVQQVGTYIREQLDQVGQSDIETKDINSLVSYVDRTAEQHLTTALSALVPEAGYITEEDTIHQNRKKYTWIIDPLDGTSNYLHKIPHYSVSVALMLEDKVIVGIVLNAANQECFYAWSQGGAYLDGRPITVSETRGVNNALIGTGFPYSVKDVAPLIRTLGHFMRYGRGIRRMGSAALDLAYVACGRYDGYYETTLNAWDVAAGALIVLEAGGHVADFSGGHDYIFGRQIIAANPHVYPEIKEVIKSNFI